MKLMKKLAFGAMMIASAYCAVVYTSCNKDKCKDVTCQNSGTCADGNCTCKAGVTGTNCETVYRASYTNNYKGNGTYTDNTGTYSLNNYHLVFTAGSDTSFTTMSMTLTDDVNVNVVTLPVIVSNFSSTSSVITILATNANVGGVNYTYAGTGTISGTIASLALTETPVSGGSATVYTFTNFAKQ